MIYAAPSTTFEAVVQGFPTGLAGTVGVQIIDNIGGVSVARVTTAVERPAGSGVYTITLTAPSTAGQYTVVWDQGTITPSTTATEELTVNATGYVAPPAGPGYAGLDDVIARMGRVAGYFAVVGNRPNNADITVFLDELSTEVDEGFRALGFDPALIDANGKKALLDLVAYGAAARALRGMGDRSPEVLSILVEADSVWTSVMGDGKSAGSLADGTYFLVTALEAGAAGGGPVISSGDFWTEEPTYGNPDSLRNEFYKLRYTNLGVGFQRGQKL